MKEADNMDLRILQSIFTIGEITAVEIKRVTMRLNLTVFVQPLNLQECGFNGCVSNNGRKYINLLESVYVEYLFFDKSE